VDFGKNLGRNKKKEGHRGEAFQSRGKGENTQNLNVCLGDQALSYVVKPL
jgi:hypothetical protein